MKHRAQFSLHDLRALLAGLASLVATPDGRQLIVDNLEARIRQSGMGSVLLDRVQLMYAYYRDPAEPLKPKLLIGAALAYLIIPNDLIPDWIALVGFTDDFAAIAFVWHQTRDILMNYDERRRQRFAEVV